MILTPSPDNRKHAYKKGVPQSLEVPLSTRTILRLNIRTDLDSRNSKITNHTQKSRFTVQPQPCEIQL